MQAAIVGMEVIEALVAMREASGLSQRALAEKIGMKQPVLAAIELGNTKIPGVLTIARIAGGLGAKMKISFETSTVAATTKKRPRRKLARTS